MTREDCPIKLPGEEEFPHRQQRLEVSVERKSKVEGEKEKDSIQDKNVYV